MMSSTGDPGLPPPKPDVLSILLEPEPADRESYVDHSVQIYKVLSGSGFQLDETLVRQWSNESYNRGLNPEGIARQFAAIISTGSRKEGLKSLTVPTLVIHGEQDFRVPVEQGIQMFTALQRQNVPSRLLYFPDEGHFILKPQNARLWWRTVLGWIDHWIQK